ncbi:MAG: Fur family transcriptional regulator [Vulcanimicrobiota bacterium]|mgnify:CR=1 FL=1
MSWTETLRSHKLRATPQRLFILATLEEFEKHGNHQHASARDILSAVQKSLPGINSTTVYRTLEDLHKVGIVDLTYHTKDQVRFSLRRSHHRHGHLVCSRCDVEQILDLELMAPLTQLIREQYGFAVEENHLTLSGICRACLASDSSPEHHPGQA